MNKILKTLLVLIAFTPIFALAGPFDPPPGDVSVLILNQIFGSLLNGGQDAFGTAITTFNSAVLALGGILAAYTILAGTLGTAHDGEMLGKKFSSVWIPIRYALGTALILPVLPQGYCIMQQIVMWLVVQGIGLADMVWSSYLSAPPIKLSAKMAYATKQNIATFAQNVALAQACTQGAASIMNDGAGSSGGIINQMVKPFGSYEYTYKINPSNPNSYMFGDQAGHFSLLTATACGVANIPPIPAPQTAAAAFGLTRQGGSSGNNKLGDLSSAFATPDATPIYTAHYNAAKNMIDNLGNLAKAAANPARPIAYIDVDKEVLTYIKAVEEQGTAYVANGDPFIAIKTATDTQGWILAGAWYTKLTMLNKQIDVSMNVSPTAIAAISLGSGFSWLDAVGPRVATMQEDILSRTGEQIIDGSVEKDDAKGKSTRNTGSSFWASITAHLTEMATGIDMGALQNDPRPPILILQEAGENMLSMWSTMMSIIAGGSLMVFGVKILGTGLDINPAITTLIGFLMIPIASMVTIGFTLAYMLPNLPFLMWIGVILGWIIMVIEAILAAPLWAVMHLHPNGDDLTGKGANGYMLVVGLTLRPALTIFGLIAALVLTDVMGEFVNKIFFNVFFTSNMGGWIAILGTIFSMAVYCMAMFSLFKKTFSLMHVIPDQLLRWIGGGGEQLGQYAGSIADGAGRGVAAATAAAGFIGEKGINTASNFLQQNQQFKLSQHEKQKSLTEIGNSNDAATPGGGDSLAQSREEGYASNGEKSPKIVSGGMLGTIGDNKKYRSDITAEKNVSGALSKVAQSGPPGGDEEFIQRLGDAAKTGYQGFKGDTTPQKRVNAANNIAGDILQNYKKEKTGGQVQAQQSQVAAKEFNEKAQQATQTSATAKKSSELKANSPIIQGGNTLAQENFHESQKKSDSSINNIVSSTNDISSNTDISTQNNDSKPGDEFI